MIIQYVAILLWGLLTVIGLMVLAIVQGSPAGLALAVVVAALTYVFQVLDLMGYSGHRINIVWAVIVMLAFASFSASAWS